MDRWTDGWVDGWMDEGRPQDFVFNKGVQ